MNTLSRSIDGVPRYFAPYVNDCFQNAYGAIAAHFGLKPELILADYLSFMYDQDTGYIGLNYLHKPSRSFEFSEEQLNTSLEYVYFPAVTHYSRRDRNEVQKLPDNKIKISLYIEDNPQIAHERLIELINLGIPVITVVDMYHMSYHSAYHNAHGAHAVVVTGYNLEEGYVEIFDKYGLSKSDFDGRMSIEEFICSRNSDNDQGSYKKPIRNMWMEVSKNECFTPDYASCKNIIVESLSRMKGEKDILGFKCGLPALESFIKDLVYKRDTMPDDDLFYLLRYYNTAFKIVSRSRTRFMVFLKEISAMVDDIEEICDCFNNSSAKWEIASNLALRLALTKNKNVMSNICRQLELIKETESRAVEKLLKLSFKREA
ncbi:BtrH N-terminal domain-containing protein [Ruminiclostridium josui]|uniref:BtrH N-terminal domain-containing protein n=1 Tax=Ruminiclostridium josui TaxID=1499 RepID=UPI000466113E|nr:BtrH N-terminal domain-containing protein [Ruminiclostridium josui]